jgi:hypothetical protein
MRSAIETLRLAESPDPNPTISRFVLPIGIYVDTQDETRIQAVRTYWLDALRQEGLTVIVEREVPGSRFFEFFAEMPGKTYKEFKQALQRLEDRAEHYAENVEKAARVVFLGAAIVTGGASAIQPYTSPKPPQIEMTAAGEKVKMSIPDAERGWAEVGKKVEEKSEKAGEIAGGIEVLAAAFTKRKREQRKKFEEKRKQEMRKKAEDLRKKLRERRRKKGK